MRNYERTLTVDSSVVDAALTNFPFLLHLSRSSGKTGVDVTHIFDVLGSSYTRLAVLDSNGVSCPVEVEKWDATAKEAWLWVKAPSVASGVDTVLTLRYDPRYGANPLLGGVNSAAGAAVWDANFVLVDHMQDYLDTSHTVDSTSNNNDGTKKAAAEPPETASGKIGKAQGIFDDLNDYIQITNSASLNINSAITIEFWVKMTTPLASDRHLISNVGAGITGYQVYYQLASKKIFLLFGTGAAWRVGNGVLGADNGAWHYITAKWDGTNITEYIDSAANAPSAQAGPIATPVVNTFIGRYPASGFFNGYLDEVRITKNVARSAAWIKASYYSETDTLLTYGDLAHSFSPSMRTAKRRSKKTIHRERVAEALISYLEFKLEQRRMN